MNQDNWRIGVKRRSMKVLIIRSPGQYSTVGEIDIDEIEGIHWGNQSGGVNRRHAGYSLYGYIDYDRAAELVNCSGEHGYYGSQAKIMIPASLNKRNPYAEGYKELLERVPGKPTYHFRLAGQKPCTTRILEILQEKGPIMRGELRKLLIMEKYRKSLIMGALNRMGKDGRIIFEASGSNIQNQIILLNN